MCILKLTLLLRSVGQSLMTEKIWESKEMFYGRIDLMRSFSENMFFCQLSYFTSRLASFNLLVCSGILKIFSKTGIFPVSFHGTKKDSIYSSLSLPQIRVNCFIFEAYPLHFCCFDLLLLYYLTYYFLLPSEMNE